MKFMVKKVLEDISTVELYKENKKPTTSNNPNEGENVGLCNNVVRKNFGCDRDDVQERKNILIYQQFYVHIYVYMLLIYLRKEGNI